MNLIVTVSDAAVYTVSIISGGDRMIGNSESKRVLVEQTHACKLRYNTLNGTSFRSRVMDGTGERKGKRRNSLLTPSPKKHSFSA